MKINCIICNRKIENPWLFQKTCGKQKCIREYLKAYQKAYQKTAKYKAYQKAYYLRKKERRR